MAKTKKKKHNAKNNNNVQKAKLSKATRVQEFADRLCSMLNIDPVEVRFSTRIPKYAQAASDPLDGIIFINSTLEELDMCLVIAHEIRHVYQSDTYGYFAFLGFKSFEECTDATEYNLQPFEVDANAFSGLIMMKILGVSPPFQYYPESVQVAIANRMEQLLREEFKYLGTAEPPSDES